MARPPSPIAACWSDNDGVKDYGAPAWCDLFMLRFARMGIDYRCHEFKEVWAGNPAEEILELFEEPCHALDLPPRCLVPKHWRYGVYRDAAAAVAVELPSGTEVYTLYEMYIKNYEFKEKRWQ